MIVHAGAHHAEPVTVLRAGDDELAIVEIDIEIFDFGAPVMREAELAEPEFGADASGPARIGMGIRQAAERHAVQLAEGATRSAVAQDGVEGQASYSRPAAG